jgi:hypothetical protein
MQMIKLGNAVNLLLALLLGLTSSAHAVTVTAQGEYLYGPETSRAKACELAKEKAKVAAVIAVLGETISTEQQLYCKATTGQKPDYNCEFNSVTWSLMDGDTKSTKVLSETVQEKMGATACTVRIEADVVAPTSQPDPNFNVIAKTNQSVFRVGDELNLEIESTLPSYFAVFNWLPYENNQISRMILSNSGDITDPDVLKKSSNGSHQFKQSFDTFWSKAYKDDKKIYDEWVIVVVTKKPVKWLSTYDLESFKERLREIPNDQKRVKRLGYQLAK